MKHNKLLYFGILFLFFSIYANAQFTSDNTRPTADAGIDRIVNIGEYAELQGSGSDLDSDPLTFAWAIVFKPAGSKAILSNNNIPNPSFIPDLEGNYMFNLKANDGQVNSLPDTVLFTTKTLLPENNKPTADAGIDRIVNIGEYAELQGLGFDLDNDTIAFRWSILSKPENSKASLSNPTAQNPTFTPDIAGFYAVQLITNDGKENSEPDTAVISAAESNGASESSRGCIDGTCDLNAKQWCKSGIFIFDDYCEHCRTEDKSCLGIIGSSCADDSECEAGLACISQICSETKPGKGAVQDSGKDSDKDGMRDKEEAEKGANPPSQASKPKGVIGTLFLAVILIIAAGAGSYGFYYYKDYFIKPKAKTSSTGFAPRHTSRRLLSPEEKIKIEQAVKKRRKAKKEKREEFFEGFFNNKSK